MEPGLKHLSARVESALLSRENGGGAFAAALDEIALALGAVTVTVHRADPAGRRLHLVASKGMPESLIPITREIPFGKGMAGLCAERLEPVTLCNLQTDGSGAARPGARETGVAGAIVVPVLSSRDGGLVGTLGIGKAAAHDYTAEEREAIGGCARALAAALERA